MLIRSQDKKSLYNLTTNKGLWIRHKNKGVAVIAEGLGELGNYTNESKAIKVLDQICSEYRISRLPTQTENLAPRICGCTKCHKIRRYSMIKLNGKSH